MFVTPTFVAQAPQELMRYREQFWASWWTPTSRQVGDLEYAMQRLRPVAELEALEARGIEGQDVLSACKCFSADTALGVDGWSP
eukprot:9023126-Pyramimonas_sp.AAC.1